MDYTLNADSRSKESHPEKSLGGLGKIVCIMIAIWVIITIFSVIMAGNKNNDAGFHAEIFIITGMLLGLIVDALIFNIWCLRYLFNKFTFLDQIELNCRRCKHLMCLRSGKKIEYRCAIRRDIMGSRSCRESQIFKKREKIVPFDKVSYLRKYAIVVAVVSALLIVLLFIFVPQVQSTNKGNLEFACLSIICGIFCLGAVIAMIVLLTEWWQCRDPKYVDHRETIIIFNEETENDNLVNNADQNTNDEDNDTKADDDDNDATDNDNKDNNDQIADTAPELTLEEAMHRDGRLGTILLSEVVAQPAAKNNLLSKIPEKEGFYLVQVKKEDLSQIRFGEYHTVNGQPFCPVTGDKKIHLKSPAELQKIFASNHSEILYVGEADNLRRRITQLVNMAFGGTAHCGGIDLWAVQDYAKYLQIEWRVRGDFVASAAAAKQDILANFKAKHHGNLPVANR